VQDTNGHATCPKCGALARLRWHDCERAAAMQRRERWIVLEHPVPDRVARRDWQ